MQTGGPVVRPGRVSVNQPAWPFFKGWPLALEWTQLLLVFLPDPWWALDPLSFGGSISAPQLLQGTPTGLLTAAPADLCLVALSGQQGDFCTYKADQKCQGLNT